MIPVHDFMCDKKMIHDRNHCIYCVVQHFMIFELWNPKRHCWCVCRFEPGWNHAQTMSLEKSFFKLPEFLFCYFQQLYRSLLKLCLHKFIILMSCTIFTFRRKSSEIDNRLSDIFSLFLSTFIIILNYWWYGL